MAAKTEFYMELRNNIDSALYSAGLKDERTRLLTKMYMRTQDAALREPKEPEFHGRMGTENLNWQNVGEAAASFKLYVQSHPIPAFAHRRVAAEYARRRMLPHAQLALEHTAQLEPMSAGIHVEQGQK